MAFISSKFNMPSYSGSGCANYKEYADLWLTKLKDAFIDASSAWSLESDIETIGSYSGDSYGLRTLQLKSSASGKYLRIWALAGDIYVYYQTSTGTNTGSSSINIYDGNVFIQRDSADLGHRMGNMSEVYFGISDSPIDADFAKDLGLNIPIFSINMATQNTYVMACHTGIGAIGYGAVVSVITDGSMFGFIKFWGSSNYNNAVIYAPDLFACANSSDVETEGAIANNGDSNSFYFGNDDNSSYTVSAVFNAADGTHNFAGMSQGFNNGRATNRLLTAENSTKMVCAPVCFWMYPYTYSGSTMSAVISGIGLKGWVNTDYVRSADSRVLPETSKGLKYASGSWLCVNKGTLICWDDSNSSPFEAA